MLDSIVCMSENNRQHDVDMMTFSNREMEVLLLDDSQLSSYYIVHYVLHFSFKQDLGPKTHPYFYDIILIILWTCTKFCGVLISSQKVIKLRSFESGVSDVIPTNVQNISCLVFFAYFL